MLGAIIGDIAGSIYEWNNYRSKDFEFFGRRADFTDDTVCTIAEGAGGHPPDNFLSYHFGRGKRGVLEFAH